MFPGPGVIAVKWISQAYSLQYGRAEVVCAGYTAGQSPV